MHQLLVNMVITYNIQAVENAVHLYIYIRCENSTITSPSNILFLTAAALPRSRPSHTPIYAHTHTYIILCYIIVHHPAATLQYARVVLRRIGTNNRARRWRRRSLSDKDIVVVVNARYRLVVHIDWEFDFDLKLGMILKRKRINIINNRYEKYFGFFDLTIFLEYFPTKIIFFF